MTTRELQNRYGTQDDRRSHQHILIRKVAPASGHETCRPSCGAVSRLEDASRREVDDPTPQNRSVRSHGLPDPQSPSPPTDQGHLTPISLLVSFMQLLVSMSDVTLPLLRNTARMQGKYSYSLLLLKATNISWSSGSHLRPRSEPEKQLSLKK